MQQIVEKVVGARLGLPAVVPILYRRCESDVCPATSLLSAQVQIAVATVMDILSENEIRVRVATALLPLLCNSCVLCMSVYAGNRMVGSRPARGYGFSSRLLSGAAGYGPRLR